MIIDKIYENLFSNFSHIFDTGEVIYPGVAFIGGVLAFIFLEIYVFVKGEDTISVVGEIDTFNEFLAANIVNILIAFTIGLIFLMPCVIEFMFLLVFIICLKILLWKLFKLRWAKK